MVVVVLGSVVDTDISSIIRPVLTLAVLIHVAADVVKDWVVVMYARVLVLATIQVNSISIVDGFNTIIIISSGKNNLWLIIIRSTSTTIICDVIIVILHISAVLLPPYTM
jgi:hypothetical protein